MPVFLYYYPIPLPMWALSLTLIFANLTSKNIIFIVALIHISLILHDFAL